MAEPDAVGEGRLDLSSADLEGGALYTVVERDGKKRLQLIPRDEDALPKVRIYPEQLEVVKALQSGARQAAKQRGAPVYRPPIEDFISAAVMKLCEEEDPYTFVLRFVQSRIMENLSEELPVD